MACNRRERKRDFGKDLDSWMEYCVADLGRFSEQSIRRGYD